LDAGRAGIPAGRPATASIPVVAPGNLASQVASRAGDLSAWVDYGAMHATSGNAPPSSGFANRRQVAAQLAPDKPVTATAAYPTALYGVSERVQAKYLARAWLEGFSPTLRFPARRGSS